jgi:hypothetical protein
MVRGMVRSLAGVLLAAIVAAALAGCGSSDDDNSEGTSSGAPETSTSGQSDQAQIKAAVDGFFTALANAEGTTACDHLSANGQREIAQAAEKMLPSLGEAPCPELIEAIAGTYGAPQKAILRGIKVNRVQVNGKRATVTIARASNEPTLVKSGDEWLIDTGFAP